MSSERRHSRLPDDPAYWDRLAVRSVDAAFGATTASVGGRAVRAHDGGGAHPWWRGISDSAYVLAASAVLALLGGSLLLDERSAAAITSADAMVQPYAIDTRPTTQPHALALALAPDNPMLASLLDDTAGPPPGSALLRLIALRVEER